MSIKQRIRKEQLGQLIISGILLAAALFFSGKDLFYSIMPAQVVTNNEEFMAIVEKNDGSDFRLEVPYIINTYFYTYTDNEADIDEYVFLADMEDTYIPVLVDAVDGFDGENTEVVEPYSIARATLAKLDEYPDLIDSVRKDLVEAELFSSEEIGGYVPAYIIKTKSDFDRYFDMAIYGFIVVLFGFWFISALFSAIGMSKPKIVKEIMAGGMSESEAFEVIDRQLESPELITNGFALTREYLIALSPTVDGISRSDITTINTAYEKSGKGAFKTKQLMANVKTNSGRTLRFKLGSEEEANQIAQHLNLYGSTGTVYVEVR